MYKINEELPISIDRGDNNFDRACDSARTQALMFFGANDAGYMDNVEGHERSCCSIEIRFVDYQMSGGMGGWSHTYNFVAKVISHEDE